MKVTASDLLINILTDEYPVTLLKVRQDNPDVSFAAEPDVSILHDLGYDVVQRTTPPTGDVVVEEAPVVVDGVYIQQWSSRAYTAEEEAGMLPMKKMDAAAKIAAIRDARFNEGYKFDFGGEYGLLTIQQREVDRLNVVGVFSIAAALVGAGMGGEPMTFRTAENINVATTAAVMVDMAKAAFAFVNQVYGASWQLKDQVDQAATLAAIPVIPDVLELPAL